MTMHVVCWFRMGVDGWGWVRVGVVACMGTGRTGIQVNSHFLTLGTHTITRRTSLIMKKLVRTNLFLVRTNHTNAIFSGH